MSEDRDFTGFGKMIASLLLIWVIIGVVVAAAFWLF